MAGVLRLFTVGLGDSAQKNKSSPRGWSQGGKGCEAACACRSPVTQKSRSQARPPLDASWQQSSALASKDYSSQSDEKSNTKLGVGGDAWVSLSEGSRHECDCAPIVVRVMRCPSSLFDAWLLQHRVPGKGDRKGFWGRALRLRVLACALTGCLSRWILTSSR